MALYWLRAGHNGGWYTARCTRRYARAAARYTLLRARGPLTTHIPCSPPREISMAIKFHGRPGNSIVATVVARRRHALSRYHPANFSPANRIYDGPSSYRRELKCPPVTASFITVRLSRVAATRVACRFGVRLRSVLIRTNRFPTDVIAIGDISVVNASIIRNFCSKFTS